MDYTSDRVLNGPRDYLGRVFCPPDAAYEQFVVPVQVHRDGVRLICLRLQTTQKLGAVPSRADEERRNKVLLQYQVVDSGTFCRELHPIDAVSHLYNSRKSVWILAKDESMIIKPADLTRFPEHDSIMQLSHELVVRLGMKGECSDEERIRWK